MKKLNKKMICNKCHHKMKKGIALKNTLRGIPDFLGDHQVVTLSYTGYCMLVPVWKCPACGHSITR